MVPQAYIPKEEERTHFHYHQELTLPYVDNRNASTHIQAPSRDSQARFRGLRRLHGTWPRQNGMETSKPSCVLYIPKEEERTHFHYNQEQPLPYVDNRNASTHIQAPSRDSQARFRGLNRDWEPEY